MCRCRFAYFVHGPIENLYILKLQALAYYESIYFHRCCNDTSINITLVLRSGLSFTAVYLSPSDCRVKHPLFCAWKQVAHWILYVFQMSF